MAMKRPGIYAPLSAHYFDDAAIMEAGEDAELLYVRMLAYAARQMEYEGFISDRVIVSRLGILPRESGNGTGNEPGTDVLSRAQALAEVGLLTREDGGYRISSWLKWNKTAAELGKERARDRQRKASDSVVSGNGTGKRSGNGTGNDAGVGKQRPDQTILSSSEIATAIPDKEDGRDDVDELCQRLADRIVANGSKQPTISQAWKREARLLLDRDGRDFTEAMALIDWCQADGFWKTNVLGMPKFREKYDQLRLRAQGEGARLETGSGATHSHHPELDENGQWREPAPIPAHLMRRLPDPYAEGGDGTL